MPDDLFAGICVNRWVIYDDERGEMPLYMKDAYTYVLGVDLLFNPVLLSGQDVGVDSKNNAALMLCNNSDHAIRPVLSGSPAKAYWNTIGCPVLPDLEKRVVLNLNHLRFDKTTGSVSDFARDSQYIWKRTTEKTSALLIAQDVCLMNFIKYPLEYFWLNFSHPENYRRMWRRYKMRDINTLQLACDIGKVSPLPETNHFSASSGITSFTTKEYSEFGNNMYNLIDPINYKYFSETHAGVITSILIKTAFLAAEESRGSRLPVG